MGPPRSSLAGEDAVLYGQGETAADALKDASSWIEDAVRSAVSDEISNAKGNGGSVTIDLTWRTYPATAVLRESLRKRGGHDDWHKREDGVLDLGRNGAKKEECDCPPHQDCEHGKVGL